MAHLKKAATGHLLKSTGGHLMNDCTGMAENICNTCSPPIPDTLYVTFANLAGDFAAYNGKQALSYRAACRWDTALTDPHVVLLWEGDPGEWGVYIETERGVYDCRKVWRQGEASAPCVPTAAYTEWTCEDAGCNDEDSCEDSAGATCVVSYT